jgi:hypothetical protein
MDWKQLIDREREQTGDTSPIVDHTFKNDEEYLVFDSGYGLPEGVPFTLWTQERVYFPVCYDGAESVRSVARFPDGKATRHIGGW